MRTEQKHLLSTKNLASVAAALVLLSCQAAWAGINQWTTNGPADGFVTAVAVNPITPTTVYAGTKLGGVQKSTISGQFWFPVTNGFQLDASVRGLTIDQSDPQVVYAATKFGGVFKTTNGGTEWKQINIGLTTQNVRAIAVDPLTPATVYAVTDGAGIFKSENTGFAWTARNVGLTDLDTTALAIDPVTPATLYVGTGGSGVFRSVDGGLHWAQKSDGLVDGDVEALVVDPQVPSNVFAGTASSGVFVSVDGGETWSARGLDDLSITALAFDGKGTLYASSDGDGVFESTDRGITWSDLNDGLGNLFVADLAVDPGGLNLHAALLEGEYDYKVATPGGVPTPPALVCQPLFGGVCDGADNVHAGCCNRSWRCGIAPNRQAICAFPFPGSATPKPVTKPTPTPKAQATPTPKGGGSNPPPKPTPKPGQTPKPTRTPPVSFGFAHDTFVLQVPPIKILLPPRVPSISQTIKVTVENSDVLPSNELPGHTVQLVAQDGDCPAGTVGVPDFKNSNAAQNTFFLEGGRSKAALVPIQVDRADVPNASSDKSPHRCTLIFKASTVLAGNVEPTNDNNTISAELNFGLTSPTAPVTGSEVLVRSLTPLSVSVKRGISVVQKTLKVSVTNGKPSVSNDLGRLITVATDDGTCPAGTVGAVSFDAIGGRHNTVTVKNGKTVTGSLIVTIDNQAFRAANGKSPARCTAQISATMSGAGIDPDTSNNTAQLPIDVVDENDF
jgi:photosystem II stability/assembly factor-like uncharacterized protein